MIPELTFPLQIAELFHDRDTYHIEVIGLKKRKLAHTTMIFFKGGKKAQLCFYRLTNVTESNKIHTRFKE